MITGVFVVIKLFSKSQVNLLILLSINKYLNNGSGNLEIPLPVEAFDLLPSRIIKQGS